METEQLQCRHNHTRKQEVISAEPLFSLPEDSSSCITLRPYQQEALEAIETARGRGITRQLVALPTGTGKTVIFAHLIQDRPKPALVLVHRDELIRQAEEKIRLVDQSAEIGILKAERDERSASIVLASVQTLARNSRLARLPKDFETVIVDEAHHSCADSYVRILDHCGSFQEPGPLTVGFTATPYRADEKALGEIFSEIVYKKDLLEMIRSGYLCDLRAIQLRLAIDLNELHTRHGDFVDSESEELLIAANAPIHAVCAYRKHAAGRKALLFTPTVRLARIMAKSFEADGIRAAAIDGDMPLPERQNILRLFGQGEITIVTNCAVLCEGYDCPSVDSIIIARPTRSKTLYTQMIGRGTRNFPAKDDCLILDLVGSTTRHDLITAASLFSVKPEKLQEMTISAAVEEQERREAVRQEKEQAQGRLISQCVDLFTRRRLHWVRTGQRFALSAGSGLIILELHSKGWSAILKEKEKTSILASAMPLEYAMGCAEDFVRKAGAKHLVDPSARWRRRAASEKQIAALGRMGIRFDAKITAGQASDLIASVIAGWT